MVPIQLSLLERATLNHWTPMSTRIHFPKCVLFRILATGQSPEIRLF